jgi:hypothetical protein
VTFYNPTPVKDDYSRATENNRVQDELQAEVLSKYSDKPLKLKYASINTTEKVNANLLYKLGIHDSQLKSGPVVSVSRKDDGMKIWGPTIIHTVGKEVDRLQKKAQAEQDAAKKAAKKT